MIKRFKKISIALLAFLALTTTLNAQPGGGGGGGMGGPGGGMGREGMQQGSEQTIPNILESAGYFEMDSEDIIKKIKVKKNVEAVSAIRKAVIDYTIGYEAVTQKYGKAIEAIKEVQKTLDKSQDMTTMRTAMQNLRQSVQGIRTEMVILHKKLSEVDIPAASLDEKQAELWTKYYAALCQVKGFTLNQPQRRQRGEGGQGDQSGGQRQRPQMM